MSNREDVGHYEITWNHSKTGVKILCITSSFAHLCHSLTLLHEEPPGMLFQETAKFTHMLHTCWLNENHLLDGAQFLFSLINL